jgi:hypothetical protein
MQKLDAPKTQKPRAEKKNQEWHGKLFNKLSYGSDPALWAKEVLGFSADEKQSQVLKSKANRLLLNCTRQWGKSTTTAAKALHRVVGHPNQLVIALSPSGRQTGELMRKIEDFAKKCQIDPKGDGDNEMSLLLANGSRIVGLPGMEATIRGFSAVSLLVIDEAARVAEATYEAVRPMLAVSDGDLWMLSTPWGKRGFFWEEWSSERAWRRMRVPATECPRISAAFLAEEREHLGERAFAQEYMCEFAEREGQVFSEEAIQRCLSEEVKPYRW